MPPTGTVKSGEGRVNDIDAEKRRANPAARSRNTFCKKPPQERSMDLLGEGFTLLVLERDRWGRRPLRDLTDNGGKSRYIAPSKVKRWGKEVGKKTARCGESTGRGGRANSDAMKGGREQSA